MTGDIYNIFASPLTSIHGLQSRNHLENDANCMGADDSLRAQNREKMFLNDKQKASLNIASVK
jgi:hypothetical protein